jgi:peptidoglycan/LPS O-acetylase OafA/YrhL
VVVLGILAATGMCGAALALAVCNEGWRKALRVGWLRWLGRVSYGIYVFHILLRPAFWQLTHRLAPVSAGQRYFVVRMVVAAAGTLAAAWISYVALERPFLRLKSRLAPRPAALAKS